MNTVKFKRICIRCGTSVSYAHECSRNVASILDKCKYCSGIPNKTLHLFVEQKEHCRLCPKCKRVVYYSNKRVLLQAVNLNKICKFCASKESAFVKYKTHRLEWKNVTGTTNITSQKLSKIRIFWGKLSEKDRKRILQKTAQQKRWFWSHLSRMSKRLGLIRLRKSFEKYRGENHWMKNPKVLRKIKLSCRKYRGDGHWFRKGKYANK